MALAITDTLITSDVTAHLACAHVPGRPEEGWQVSWLPGRVVDRSTAISAMTLAELANAEDGIGLHDDYPDPRWLQVEALAAELGLSGPDAVVRASTSPGLESGQ
jgi:hypothetical protein